MTLHFPDEVDTNVLTIDATDPKSGTAEFKAAAIRVEKIAAATREQRGTDRGTGGCALTRTGAGYDRSMDVHLLDAVADLRRAGGGRRRARRPHLGWEGGARRSRRGPGCARWPRRESSRRHLLLPVLQAVHEHVGWLSPGALNYVCQRLTVPPADAYGVATFYALFSLEWRPPRVVHVCDDLACRCNGSDELIAGPRRAARPRGHGRQRDSATWLRSPCLGQCDRAPAALLTVAGDAPEEHVLAPVAADGRRRALAGRAVTMDPPHPFEPQAGSDGLRLLRRVGRVDPRSLDDYRAHGGYSALRRAIDIGPELVIREVKDSKLLGRGAPRSRWESSGKPSRASRRSPTT